MSLSQPAPKLTPEEALKNLALAASEFNGKLAQHQALQESLFVLEQLIKSQAPTPATPASDGSGAPAAPTELN